MADAPVPEAKAWMIKSWRDLETARRSTVGKPPFYDVAVYHCQQAAWPIQTALVFWFSFGGHWVEIWFLNWLRPRLPQSRIVHVTVRLAVWFVGGVVLGFGIVFTMRLFELTRGNRQPAWWVAGVVFVVVELIAHSALALLRRPNFYDGEG